MSDQHIGEGCGGAEQLTSQRPGSRKREDKWNQETIQLPQRLSLQGLPFSTFPLLPSQYRIIKGRIHSLGRLSYLIHQNKYLCCPGKRSTNLQDHLFKAVSLGGQRDGSEAKRVCCSCSRSGFNPQHPRWVADNCLQIQTIKHPNQARALLTIYRNVLTDTLRNVIC